MKDTQGEADHGIKCKYMLAARGYLSNTTFHGIPWVLEDISKGAKVKHYIYWQRCLFIVSQITKSRYKRLYIFTIALWKT